VDLQRKYHAKVVARKEHGGRVWLRQLIKKALATLGCQGFSNPQKIKHY